MRGKINDLKSQLHTALDMFYKENGMVPEVVVVSREVESSGKKFLATSIEVKLK